MGYIAKADGRITENEIATTRQVIAHLGLSGAVKERAIKYFHSGKRADFDLQTTINQLALHAQVVRCNCAPLSNTNSISSMPVARCPHKSALRCNLFIIIVDSVSLRLE